MEISRKCAVVVELLRRKACVLPEFWVLQQSVVAGVCKHAALLWEFTAARGMPRAGSLCLWWSPTYRAASTGQDICEEQQGSRAGPGLMPPLCRTCACRQLSPAHGSSGLPQKQCLTGQSQYQLCNTTWQLRLIFCETFPPYISISFFIYRRIYTFI